MLIRVTQEHIKRGKQFSPLACPIALAAEEIGLKNVAVDPDHLHYGPYTKERKHLPLPGVASCFIYNFDSGYPISPIEFEV